MEKQLRGNIWKYAILLIANKRVFVAILGAYYLTVPDVTPKIVGIILLAGSLSGFLFEIPSGYMSDKIGHKRALVISRILMLLSTILFLFADSVTLLIMAGIFMSASAAFLSGTGSAFMHETLRALNREREYSNIMGKVSSIGFAIPIVFMVFVPFLVDISYKAPFLISLVIDAIGLFAVLSLTTPPVLQEHVEEVRVTNFKQVVREGYRSHFFSLALFSGIVSGMLFALGGFRAPYQEFLEIPVIWYGVFFGVGRALASLVLAYSGFVRKYLTLDHFYLFQVVLYSVLLFVLGSVSNVWVVVIVFILANAFQWGLSRVDEGYLLDVIRSSKFKATLLSVCSQLGYIFSAISSYGIGLLIEQTSYQRSFTYFGVIFLAMVTVLYLYILRKYRKGLYQLG